MKSRLHSMSTDNQREEQLFIKNALKQFKTT